MTGPAPKMSEGSHLSDPQRDEDAPASVSPAAAPSVRQKLAPGDDDGRFPYLVTTTSVWRPGSAHSKIVWEYSLIEAKRGYGWSRDRHEMKTVRRARVADMEQAS